MFLTQSIFKNYNKFYFSKRGNLAKVYLKFTYSNIIISLTDYKDKLIACHTSGSLVLLALEDVKLLHKLLKLLLKNYFLIYSF